MKITKLNAYAVRLPLKGEFSTSKQKRLFTETVIVELVAERDGLRGYGESTPVEFVTGETPESVIETIKVIAQHKLFPKELSSLEQIQDLVEALPFERKTNDATCAVEIALLDLLGRHEGKPVVDYFDKTFFTSNIHYAAIIPLGAKDTVIQFCNGIKKLGITQVRVKMGQDYHQNKDTLKFVRKSLGDSCVITVDPNAIWDKDLAFKHLPLLKEISVKTVEEPMPRDADGFERFAEALRDSGIYLMACESAATLNEVRKILLERLYQIINIKLSRNGGLTRCLKLIDLIRESRLLFQIGCAVGESGILSAAGRALGLLCKDALCYDGSYDAHILQENVTSKDVSFGYHGQAGPLSGSGLGVEIDTHRLKKFSRYVTSVTF